jgi:chaperonin GroEL (HSP60 family)
VSAKQVVFQDEARARIVSGVTQLAHAVRGTLGPCAPSARRS